MCTSFQHQHQSLCPLCGRAATLFKRDYDHWHHHFCESCGEFEVSELVRLTVEQASVDMRARISAQVRRLSKGQYLQIRADSCASKVPGNTPWVTKVVAAADPDSDMLSQGTPEADDAELSALRWKLSSVPRRTGSGQSAP